MQLLNGQYIHDFFNFKFADYYDINSLAHSLALQNRYTGHSFYPVSVAQHLCLTSELALIHEEDISVIFACHIHDLSEALAGDVNRCIKRLSGMEAYREREHALELEIFQFHRLPTNSSFMEKISHYDNLALSIEASQVMHYEHEAWNYIRTHFPVIEGIYVHEIDWRTAKEAWLERYNQLSQEYMASEQYPFV